MWWLRLRRHEQSSIRGGPPPAKQVPDGPRSGGWERLGSPARAELRCVVVGPDTSRPTQFISTGCGLVRQAVMPAAPQRLTLQSCLSTLSDTETERLMRCLSQALFRSRIDGGLQSRSHSVSVASLIVSVCTAAINIVPTRHSPSGQAGRRAAPTYGLLFAVCVASLV